MKNFISGNAPPRSFIETPIVHNLSQFYQKLYVLGKKLPKRDRFGLHAKVEEICACAFELAITASFEEKLGKTPTIKNLRIKLEILKRMIRNSFELKIISEEKYVELFEDLEKISKMANGWLKYLKQQESR